MYSPIAASEILPFGERLSTALIDSLLGMVIVFSALIILWLVIELFHKCVSAASRSSEKKKAAESLPAETVEPIAEPVEETDEAAVVAAITAAISVMTEAPVGSFRVVSFKRSGSNAHWNRR